MPTKKVELGVGLDIDTMPAERLREEINRITQSAEKLNSVDMKAGTQMTDNLERQVSLMDKAIEKQKEFIRQQASGAYMAGVDPETRGQMAADIFKQHREAGLAAPTEQEVNRMVVQQGREMRVGVRGERERLTTMQKRRQEVQEAMADETEQRQQADEESRGRRGAIAGTGRGILGAGMKGIAIGAALIGAGGIVGTLIQGARWANELNNIVARINVQSEEVGDNIGRWSAGTAMARIEASRYAEQSMRAFGRGGMSFLPGVEFGGGFQQGELLRYAPMLRMGGIESEAGIRTLLGQGRRAAGAGGREFDIFGLLQGTAMATDVLGRSLVTPSPGAAMTSISAIQQAYGQGMSPERAARIGMQLHGAMTSQDATRRSFMLRSLGFEGGNLEDYQQKIMQIEKGVGDPQNIRSMLGRARQESGGRSQMIQLMSGMGLSMTQASGLVERYLSGDVLTDEQISKAMAKPSDKELEQARRNERSVTILDNAVKSFKDASTSLGKTTLTILEPALKVAQIGIGKFEQAVILFDKTVRRMMGEAGEAAEQYGGEAPTGLEKALPFLRRKFSAQPLDKFKGETALEKDLSRLMASLKMAEAEGRTEGGWLSPGIGDLKKQIAQRQRMLGFLESPFATPVGERGMFLDPTQAGTQDIPTPMLKRMAQMSEGFEGKQNVFYRNNGNTYVIQAPASALHNALEIFENVIKEESAGGMAITPEEQKWISKQPAVRGGLAKFEQLTPAAK